MDNTSAMFRSVVKGSNFMTPDVLRYGFTGKYVYELSEGRGMDNQPIFGLTVVDWAVRPSERKHNRELSQLFYSREFAEAVAADLK